MVEQIDAAIARDRLAQGVALIDVREEDEWRQAHVEGSVLMPLSRFAAMMDDLPDGALIILCAAGARSQQAALFLESQGRKADNLRGGIQAWWAAGLPLVRED